jgi:hypothetical protein
VGKVWIPDTRTGGWISTNPRIHHELSTAKNKACGGRFVPFVKMIKGMNRHLQEPVRPSFLLEVMGHSIVLEPFGEYPEEVRWFLATAAEQVGNAWPDPVGLGPDVNTMSANERASAAAALTALAVAEEAIDLTAPLKGARARSAPASDQCQHVHGRESAEQRVGAAAAGRAGCYPADGLSP